jgi:hypothetical protein
VGDEGSEKNVFCELMERLMEDGDGKGWDGMEWIYPRFCFVWIGFSFLLSCIGYRV